MAINVAISLCQPMPGMLIDMRFELRKWDWVVCMACFAVTALVAAVQATSAGLADETQSPSNVLLILVDDLKPALGCYGDPAAKTPHIDELAGRGMRFDLAYCNQAVCAPSRFTLMLGSHSTSTGLYGLGNHLRKALPNAKTMPQHFADHGYRTESLGKVFHVGHGNFGDPQSFSVPHFGEKVIEYLVPESTEGGQLTREEAYFTNQMLVRFARCLAVPRLSHRLPRTTSMPTVVWLMKPCGGWSRRPNDANRKRLHSSWSSALHDPICLLVFPRNIGTCTIQTSYRCPNSKNCPRVRPK